MFDADATKVTATDVGSAVGAVHIAPAGRAAAAALAAIEESCFTTDRLTEAEFERRLDDSDFLVLALRAHDGLGGLIVGQRSGNGRLYVESLAIHPDLRRRGLASALLNALVDAAREWDCRSMELEVREDNLEAVNLYRTLGFAFEERVEDWYEDGAAARRARVALDRFGCNRVRRKPDRPTLLIVSGGDLQLQPSLPGSLITFAEAAEAAGLNPRFWSVEEDVPPLADAAFIRTHTEVGGRAELVAATFERRGAPVIDHPSSIARGCNKIHQSLVFAAAGVSTPTTHFVFSMSHLDCAVAAIGAWPIVVKDPVGSFCRGVELAHCRSDLERLVTDLLASGHGVVLQSFEPTGFDWRIGILSGQPLFAAKYGMAAGSWKICASDGQGERWGPSEGVPLAEAPAQVVKMALRAARALGDGLWGVDLKVVNGRPMVIEVNDNPNIDDHIEAAVAEDRVWERTAGWFADAIARSHPAAWRTQVLSG